MKKIIANLSIITIVLLMSAGATRAYFSDTASVTGNTFSTGTLEIRVNGQPTVLGAVFDPAVPGTEYTSPVYGMQNYGPPWFGGPSNLTANTLLLNVANPSDTSSDLWDELMVRIEVGRSSGVTWYNIYEGFLKDISDLDLFNGHWTELIPGSTQDMRYTVWVEEDGDQSELMGESLIWDFVIEGRTN